MAESNEDLKDIVLNYWRSPGAMGSFGGLLALQTGLKLEKNIHVSIKELRNIMKSSEVYLQHIINKLRFDRRRYADVYGYFSLLACDIAYMNPVDIKKSFPNQSTSKNQEKYLYILACQVSLNYKLC